MAIARENTQVLKKHAKTFYLASLFLPIQVAKDASSLYRFAREVDDIVDENPEKEAREILEKVVKDYREESGAYPFVSDFLSTSNRLNMDKSYAEELIKGVTWDLDNDTIYTEEDFYLYCYRVAGVVGLMMCFMLKTDDQTAYQHATDLGLGMQMTNICRDVLEDLDRGRMYLPVSWMDDILLNKNNIQVVSIQKKVMEVLVAILKQAEKHYASADLGMCYIPWRARFAILVAAKVYRAIGLKILKDPQKPLEGRVYVSKLEKLGWLIYCSFYFLHPRIWKKPNQNSKAVLHDSLFGLPGLQG